MERVIRPVESQRRGGLLVIKSVSFGPGSDDYVGKVHSANGCGAVKLSGGDVPSAYTEETWSAPTSGPGAGVGFTVRDIRDIVGARYVSNPTSWFVETHQKRLQVVTFGGLCGDFHLLDAAQDCDKDQGVSSLRIDAGKSLSPAC